VGNILFPTLDIVLCMLRKYNDTVVPGEHFVPHQRSHCLLVCMPSSELVISANARWGTFCSLTRIVLIKGLRSLWGTFCSTQQPILFRAYCAKKTIRSLRGTFCSPLVISTCKGAVWNMMFHTSDRSIRTYYSHVLCVEQFLAHLFLKRKNRVRVRYLFKVNQNRVEHVVAHD
jgi:hypothetical protein